MPTPVLIADDVPANLLAMEAALQPLDLDTVRAHSGEEAVRITAGREFAVILMDVRMPGMDGVEAATVIRRRPEGCDTPIVLVSAIDRDLVHIERGYQAGAIDYLLKPLDGETLRAKVAGLTNLWQERQGQRREGEQRLGALQQELRRTAARNAQLMAWFGHELRNPLSAMASVLELRRRRGPPLTEWEQTMARQVARLTDVAGELFRLERDGGDPPTPIHGRRIEAAPAAQRPRVLLVDDNEDTLSALAELLRDAGADVATASTGAEVLQIAVDFHPEAAVVDIGLPDLDGHELGRRLRSALGGRALMLFALSGFGGREHLERSRGAGFDDHFVKPPDMPHLLSALRLAPDR
jgi:CheY-like chemotaxis protein